MGKSLFTNSLKRGIVMIVLIISSAVAIIIYKLLDLNDNTEEIIANAWEEED